MLILLLLLEHLVSFKWVWCCRDFRNLGVRKTVALTWKKLVVNFLVRWHLVLQIVCFGLLRFVQLGKIWGFIQITKGHFSVRLHKKVRRRNLLLCWVYFHLIFLAAFISIESLLLFFVSHWWFIITVLALRLTLVTSNFNHYICCWMVQLVSWFGQIVQLHVSSDLQLIFLKFIGLSWRTFFLVILKLIVKVFKSVGLLSRLVCLLNCKWLYSDFFFIFVT